MAPPVFILDACVLYPVAVRDLMLTLAALDAFEPKCSREILDEMRRNVLGDYPDIDPTHFDERMIGAISKAFPRAVVTGFESLAEQLDNDPADRHVAAAAIVANADAIITEQRPALPQRRAGSAPTASRMKPSCELSCGIGREQRCGDLADEPSAGMRRLCRAGTRRSWSRSP